MMGVAAGGSCRPGSLVRLDEQSSASPNCRGLRWWQTVCLLPSSIQDPWTDRNFRGAPKILDGSEGWLKKTLLVLGNLITFNRFFKFVPVKQAKQRKVEVKRIKCDENF